jgi:release factor glutamine methyltransferase
LIPRPETEELVHWIVSDHRKAPPGLNILDIGAGSGCIVLSLLKALPDSRGTALDIEPAALEVVQDNANIHGVDIDNLRADILDDTQWNQLGSYDVVVCNPPYIMHSEKDRMGAEVLQYEPHSALFVSNADPLQFYRKIMDNVGDKINLGGALYFETSDLYHDELNALLASRSWQYEFRKDMQGAWRMLKVQF